MNLATLIHQKPHPIPQGIGRLHRIKTTADDFVSVLGKAQTCHGCGKSEPEVMFYKTGHIHCIECMNKRSKDKVPA